MDPQRFHLHKMSNHRSFTVYLLCCYKFLTLQWVFIMWFLCTNKRYWMGFPYSYIYVRQVNNALVRVPAPSKALAQATIHVCAVQQKSVETNQITWRSINNIPIMLHVLKYGDHCRLFKRVIRSNTETRAVSGFLECLERERCFCYPTNWFWKQYMFS